MGVAKEEVHVEVKDVMSFLNNDNSSCPEVSIRPKKGSLRSCSLVESNLRKNRTNRRKNKCKIVGTL